MARLRTFGLALVCAVIAAFCAPADARYYGRVTRVGFYGRNRWAAPYSRYYGRRRGVVVIGRHRHLLDDEGTDSENGVSPPMEEEQASDEACMTLKELLESRPDEFSSLLQAIENLPEEMKEDIASREEDSDFEYTFFAPTNDGIKQFTDWLGEQDVQNSEFVKNGTAALAILSYHLVPDVKAQSTDLKNDQMLVTSLGDQFPLKVELADGGVTIKGVGSEANVIEADIPTCKGVVHVVNDVLLPVDGDGEIDEDGQLKSAVKEEIDRLQSEEAEKSDDAGR